MWVLAQTAVEIAIVHVLIHESARPDWAYIADVGREPLTVC